MKKLVLFIFLLTFSIGQTQTPAAGPTTTPPARNAWDVLSQYGSQYTNQSGVYFDSFGGSNIVGDVTLSDLSVVKKYLSHSYSGIAPNGANNLNVSEMTHLHLDVWSPDFVSFKVKLEGTNGSNVELEVPFAKTQGSWNSYDLDLSTYAGVSLANLKWIVPVTFDPNNTTLFITNVYFYRPATIQPPTLGIFTVPAQLVGAPDFVITPPTSNSGGAFSYSSTNTNVATIVNGNELHIVGGGSSTIIASQAADGPFGSGSTTAAFVASYPAPGVSPIPPIRVPSTVVSMFTGTPAQYANVVNAIRAPWTAGTTLTTIPNGTDTCLQVDNLGYLGYITDGANFSAAGMTKLHIDIYLNAPIANMFIFLLSNGDQNYNSGPLVTGWNSLDITLAATYPGANLNDIYGFKFEQNVGPPIQMYLDNIYFYAGGNDPIITDFTVPAKVFGDAPFTLTEPTSNSAGAFTYSSNNFSVATISGNVVTVTGVGTATITANQAANGSFDAGSTTAILVVTAPALATAAPTPPARNTWDVVSLYSNAYTTLPSAVWVGASTLTDEVLEGNDTKKMSNFIVEFINFAATDVSQMTTLHMDIYTPDCPGFNIWLLNNGDRNAQIFPAINGWRSIDIPLSTYVNNGLNMSAIIQLKFEGLFGPGKTAYVDNVYFYRAATLQPPTVGLFVVPAKNVGDADFALTPPTSNNTSPFVYTSSNTSVATIVGGNQVQIITGGTTIITASQVSDGTYGPSSKTATFVVSFPAPGPSPIPPSRDPASVVSMFTGSPSVYPNAINMVRSNWTGATTMTTIPNGTNTALKVDNLGFLGLVNQGDINFSAAGMTNLHMDVYLNAPLNSNPALSRLFIFLLSNGDQFHEEANLVAGWNSLNISLSQYPGANLSDIYGLKLEQNTSGPAQIYLDNIYFSNDTTKIITSQCGSTLVSLNTLVFANNVPTATQYRFKVTNPASTSVIYETPNRYFRITNLASYEFATTYNVEVELQIAGVWTGYYGAVCTITTPALPVLTVGTACVTNITTRFSGITTTNIAGALQYKFRVLRVAPGAVAQEITTNWNGFLMHYIGGFVYGSTYNVEVAVKTPGSSTFSAYGSPCVVNTPAVPTLAAGSCDVTVTSNFQAIATTNLLTNATGYKFEITSLAGVVFVEQASHWFYPTTIPGYVAGTNYSVRVAVKNGALISEYGESCDINPVIPARFGQAGTPSAGGTDFKAVGSPNPFATNFILNVTTTSDEKVKVSVYDMIGKQLESKEVNAIDANALEVGANYPSGVYNVIVSQGAELKSLRMIKR